MKILLVENRELRLDILMAMIAGGSKQVEICGHMDEAKEKLKTFTADAMIVDRDVLNESDDHSGLDSVPVVIVVDTKYMDEAGRWIKAGQSQEGAENASKRKAILENINEIWQRMAVRHEEVKSLLGSAMSSDLSK